jgi:hypothetical protein
MDMKTARAVFRFLSWPLTVGFAASGLLAGDETGPEKTNLFEARTGGYHTFRIPGIVVTAA